MKNTSYDFVSHLILFINTSINATIIISDNNNSGLRRQPFNNIKKDDTSYGHTFLVKVHNNTKYGTRIYVHTDCRVALLDGNNIQKEMANSLIAISNPLGSPCNKNDVNGIGVSTSGTYAIVTYGTSISVLSFAENDEDDDLNIPKTIPKPPQNIPQTCPNDPKHGQNMSKIFYKHPNDYPRHAQNMPKACPKRENQR